MELIIRIMKQCKSCKKDFGNLETVKVKEEGVCGYYDVEVEWYGKCVASHNYYLMANWG